MQCPKLIFVWNVLFIMGVSLSYQLEGLAVEEKDIALPVVISVPPKKREEWYDFWLKDDDKGSLLYMAKTMEKWEEQKEFIDNWNLEDVSVYRLALGRDKDKLKFMTRGMLLFLNEKLEKKIRQARKGEEVGSGWKKVDEIKTAIYPEFSFADPRHRLRLKARLFLREATLLWQNPYFEGQMILNLRRKERGRVSIFQMWNWVNVLMEVSYFYHASYLEASARKEITPHILGKISIRTPDGNMNWDQGGKRLEILYTETF